MQLVSHVGVTAEKRSGLVSNEIVISFRSPTDFGSAIDVGGLQEPGGIGGDLPSELVVNIGTEVRQLAHAGDVTLSTTLLLLPIRSIVWRVRDRTNIDEVIRVGPERAITVAGNAVVRFTVHDDSRGIDFFTRMGEAGSFVATAGVTDYKGNVVSQEITVAFLGSRLVTSGYDRVRDLMDLDGRLAGIGGVPQRPGPVPDPAPDGPFLGDKLPSRDGAPSPGRPGPRDLARRAATASLSRSEFNGSDPRPALLRHLAKRSRQAVSRSDAVIERAVEQWTNAILNLPDAQTLASRDHHGSKGPPTKQADVLGTPDHTT